MQPEDVPPDRHHAPVPGHPRKHSPEMTPLPDADGTAARHGLPSPRSPAQWELDPAPTLRRSLATLPVVGAGTAAAALAPLPESVSSLAVLVIPLVFIVAFSLDLLDDAADRYPLLDRIVGRAAEISEGGGAGFYGSVAAAEFLRREFFSLRDAVGEATSVLDFFISHLVQLGLDTVMNALWSGLWPIAWSMRFGWANVAMVAAASWVAWALGRWTLVEREVAPGHAPGELLYGSQEEDSG